MLTIKTPKNAKIFTCERCNFKCSKQSDFIRHNMTAKHQMLTYANKKTPKNAKTFICNCGKEYKQAPSLTRHKKKCTYEDNMNNDIIDNSLIINEKTNDAVPIHHRANDCHRTSITTYGGSK